MWEYRRIQYSIITFNELNNFLNEESKNNWEIVYYNESHNIAHILFKRLIKDSNKNVL